MYHLPIAFPVFKPLRRGLGSITPLVGAKVKLFYSNLFVFDFSIHLLLLCLGCVRQVNDNWVTKEFSKLF